MKDDSGAYAVFTEQGSSASHMTAAKVMDAIARLPDRDGQAADAISAYTQVKMEDVQKLLNSPNQNVQMYGYDFQNINGRSRGNTLRILLSILNEPYKETHSQDSCGKDSSKKSIDGTWLGKSTKLEMLIRSQKTKIFFSVYVVDIKMAGKKPNLVPVWKKLMKDVDI